MRQHSEILQNIYQSVTTEIRNPDGSIRTKGGLPMKDVVCCACGDGRGGCEVDPNFHFCCSPYSIDLTGVADVTTKIGQNQIQVSCKE
jgi:hypothetical protein